MKNYLLACLLIILSIFFIACDEKSDTIVNNNYYYYNAEDSLWEETNGPFGGNVWEMKISDKDEIYLSGGNPWGIYASMDYGKTWNNLTANRPYQYYSVSFNDRFEIFSYDKTVTNQTKIYKSSDKGLTWTKIMDTIPGTIYVIFYLTDSKGNIFANARFNPPYKNSLVKSSDNGNSWTVSIDSLLGINYSLFIDSKDNLYMPYYGEDSKTHLLFSSDKGAIWSDIYQEKGSLSFYQDLSGTLFKTVNSGRNLEFSTDFGKTWTKAGFAGLRGEAISSVTISNKNNMYISTDFGVFRSTDSGQNWKQIIKSQIVKNICLDSKGYLYALMTNGALNRTKKPVE